MVEVKVNAGVCGFITTIKADSEDMQNANIEIETDCPNLKPLEKEIKEADSYAECFTKLGESKTFETCKKYCKHPACPVPTGILKAVEAACGLALPRDAEIKITKL
jgi:hypothetical protein